MVGRKDAKSKLGEFGVLNYRNPFARDMTIIIDSMFLSIHIICVSAYSTQKKKSSTAAAVAQADPCLHQLIGFRRLQTWDLMLCILHHHRSALRIILSERVKDEI